MGGAPLSHKAPEGKKAVSCAYNTERARRDYAPTCAYNTGRGFAQRHGGTELEVDPETVRGGACGAATLGLKLETST